jgi:hypothetical protein
MADAGTRAACISCCRCSHMDVYSMTWGPGLVCRVLWQLLMLQAPDALSPQTPPPLYWS